MRNCITNQDAERDPGESTALEDFILASVDHTENARNAASAEVAHRDGVRGCASHRELDLGVVWATRRVVPLGFWGVGGLGQAEDAAEGGAGGLARRHCPTEGGVPGLLARQDTALNGVDVGHFS